MYLFISFIPKAAKTSVIFMKNVNEDFGIANKVELAYAFSKNGLFHFNNIYSNNFKGAALVGSALSSQ